MLAYSDEEVKDEPSTRGTSEGNEEALTAEEAEHRRAMEYNEDDENEPEEIHLREAAVTIPSIPKPQSSDGDVSLGWLSAFNYI